MIRAAEERLSNAEAEFEPMLSEPQRVCNREEDRKVAKPSLAGAENQEAVMVKWGSLVLLVVQNSSLFVITRLSRPPEATKNGHLYLASVVVLLVELCKMAICLFLIVKQSGYNLRASLAELHRHLWLDLRTTLLLGVPAICYAVQNNLVFVAITNLSAAAAQVLYQLKTLSTAFFSVTILGKSFRIPQWISFVLLMAGVCLVQSQDAKSSASATGAYPALGVCAAVAAAALSGFAGVYLEKMFTSGGTSLWVRNVQLGVFAIPLQAFAIYQLDWQVVSQRGLFHGFHPITWLVVVVQVAGALLTAIVIKFAGNILKTCDSPCAPPHMPMVNDPLRLPPDAPLLCWHRHHRDVGVALCAARRRVGSPGLRSRAPSQRDGDPQHLLHPRFHRGGPCVFSRG